MKVFLIGVMIVLASCGNVPVKESKPIDPDQEQSSWIMNNDPPIKVLAAHASFWDGHWVVLSSANGKTATFYGTGLSAATPGLIVRDK
jgi:hypothetical protein